MSPILASVLTSRAGGALRFFLLWLRRPGRVGAIVPSGSALAGSMAGCIDVDAPGVVIELGGGTGCITEAILEAGIAPEDLIVVERERALCDVIAARCPNVRVLHSDARELETVLRQSGMPRVKAVVSGLPLLSLKNADCHRILDAAFSVLDDNGEFLQFTYGPSTPISREILMALGIEGSRAGWVLHNVPPAAIWRFARPDIAATHRRAA